MDRKRRQDSRRAESRQQVGSRPRSEPAPSQPLAAGPRPDQSARITGIHAVREALRAQTRPLQYVVVSRDRRDARLQEIVELSRRAGVPVRFESAQALDRIADGERHQGVVAIAAAKQTVDLEDLLTGVQPGAAGLLLALDGIEDPHNLGAILRSACGAGVHGVILPARRSVGLTETVDRVSAGALEYMRVASVPNLVQALERSKQAGYWIVGLDSAVPQMIWEADFSLPVVLVIGAEGRGLHELTRKRCDFLVSIPMQPGVESLNASAAAAVALFEIVRQRRLLQHPKGRMEERA